ncbi:glutathione S-transferas-like protein [Clathrospora elynae]|uniref:Glutathione S-transferas-like protein n=1 Tax=Clathrospora elynae TaxID=706981 RepID=A0A6A5SH26_9PLEO|nr:glutathione S-transferas-like protein [Clathrospora elynae]
MSSSSIKPIKIYGKHGPNPPKIIMLAEELGLPYEVVDTQFTDVKKPEYLAVNPNGRMPAIHDPNTGLTLWESGAIIEYLVEKYDTKHSISFKAGSNEAYLAKQWLFYQVSGQGPYFGQAMWFTIYHSEQLPSAQDRYYAEIKRVTGVLEDHLKKQVKGKDGPWLVGGKYSFADMAFVPWQAIAGAVLGQKVDLKEFTEVSAWIEKMKARKSIGPVLEAAMSN